MKNKSLQYGQVQIKRKLEKKLNRKKHRRYRRATAPRRETPDQTGQEMNRG